MSQVSVGASADEKPVKYLSGDEILLISSGLCGLIRWWIYIGDGKDKNT